MSESDLSAPMMHSTGQINTSNEENTKTNSEHDIFPFPYKPVSPAKTVVSDYVFNPSTAEKAFQTIFERIPRVVIEIDEHAKPSRINVGGYYPQIAYLRKNQTYKSLRDFVAIDVETTGLEVGYQKIIQISAIRFLDLKAIEIFETYINPGKHIPLSASEINHITDDMVSSAPYFEQIVDSLDRFIGTSHLVAHNIEFDIRFLRKSGYDNEKFQRKYYDTLQISRSRDKYADNHKLTTACDYHNIHFDNAHSATSDALACGLLFLSYIRSDVDSCVGLNSEYDEYKQIWDMYRKTMEHQTE